MDEFKRVFVGEGARAQPLFLLLSNNLNFFMASFLKSCIRCHRVYVADFFRTTPWKVPISYISYLIATERRLFWGHNCHFFDQF